MDVQQAAACVIITALIALAPACAAHAQGAAGEIMPAWVKTLFVYYANDEITDAEIITALQYLIRQNIIQVTVATEDLTLETERETEWPRDAEVARSLAVNAAEAALAAEVDAFNAAEAAHDALIVTRAEAARSAADLEAASARAMEALSNARVETAKVTNLEDAEALAEALGVVSITVLADDFENNLAAKINAFESASARAAEAAHDARVEKARAEAAYNAIARAEAAYNAVPSFGKGADVYAARAAFQAADATAHGAEAVALVEVTRTSEAGAEALTELAEALAEAADGFAEAASASEAGAEALAEAADGFAEAASASEAGAEALAEAAEATRRAASAFVKAETLAEVAEAAVGRAAEASEAAEAAGAVP